jgi:putative toxin-antitoxin system antitoxin component (TIGR02293 family)
MDKLSENRVGTVMAKYAKHYSDSISMVVSSKKGLKAQAFFDFQDVSRFSNQLMEELLKKTLKTFTTYKQQQAILDPVISEKLLKLFSLYQKGLNVFDSVEEFNKWLAEPAFGLGSVVPTTLLDTITGIDLVEEELTRIEYGDLA